jgi:hypothetical protein
MKPKRITLNVAALRHAYELLADTAPFNRWNLPDSHDVIFRVMRARDTAGDYEFDRKSRHIIRISARCVGSLFTLLRIMAHEMIHLYQAHTRPRTDTANVAHNAAFRRLSDEVCHYHGFDRAEFADLDA